MVEDAGVASITEDVGVASMAWDVGVASIVAGVIPGYHVRLHLK